MKNSILLVIMFLFGLSAFCEDPVKVKPSQMSEPTKQAFKHALGIDLIEAKLNTTLSYNDGVLNYSAAQIDSARIEYPKKYNVLKALGSTCKTLSKIPNINSYEAVGVNDGILALIELEQVPYSYTATSIRFFQYTQGVYTGDNNNRIGLYKFEGTTFTLVASIPNDATLWTTAATGTVVTKTFTAPYTVPANEKLYAALLSNCSGTATTIPSVTGSTGNTAYYDNALWGTTYPLALQKTAQTDLPASFDISTCIRLSGQPMVIIF
jgi:hypothetical protein